MKKGKNVRNISKSKAVARILTGLAFTGVLFFAAANASAEVFPDFYEGENGRVSYHCRLQIPENLTGAELSQAKVEKVCSSNYEKALALLAKGRTVESEDIYPAEGIFSEMRYYTFSDGAILLTGDTTNFATANNDHYYQVFSKLDQSGPEIAQDTISWGTPREAEQEVRDLMEQLGYTVNVGLSVFALPYETAKEWEEHTNHDGEYVEEAYKPDWSEADDAYMVYGYQIYEGLPVYHEQMLLGGPMKYLNASNAAVQAVRTKGEMERFTANFLYQIEKGEGQIPLCSFDSVADTVSEKLNSYFDEAQYEVTDAVLVWIVRHNQEQGYDIFPGWYVEAKSQNGTEAVLVDASTAGEVFVN